MYSTFLVKFIQTCSTVTNPTMRPCCYTEVYNMLIAISSIFPDYSFKFCLFTIVYQMSWNCIETMVKALSDKTLTTTQEVYDSLSLLMSSPYIFVSSHTAMIAAKLATQIRNIDQHCKKGKSINEINQSIKLYFHITYTIYKEYTCILFIRRVLSMITLILGSKERSFS